MAKFSISTFAVMALFAVPAVAADMPAVAKRYEVPFIHWSGWYVGGNIGHGWADNTGARWDTVVDAPQSGAATATYFAAGGNVLPGTRPSGMIGGAQVGFDHRAANWVMGIVTDIQASAMRASAANTVTPQVDGFPTTKQSNSSGIDWFGTVRGRVGYAADNWLVYGTGGVAYGKVRSNMSVDCVDCPVPVGLRGTASSMQIGWAAGAGVEVGLTRDWTVGVEYLRIDLGSISTTVLPYSDLAAASSIGANSRFATDVVRASLNYRFTSALVTARY